MTVAVGKFDVRPAIRFISRWEVDVLEPLVFNDPLHGLQVVPDRFRSDLASIRVLREACRWAAIGALAGWVFAWGWSAVSLLVLAIGSLALYGLLAGYGMRAAILHDWLYEVGILPAPTAMPSSTERLRLETVQHSGGRSSFTLGFE
jgi:hypothetical protein